jgi:hypothetical protein
MTLPLSTMPGDNPKPLHWWNFRRRARRLAFLELVASTEIRISLDGTLCMAGTLEDAYGSVIGFGSADHVRGLAFADILKLNSGCPVHDDGEAPHTAVISMRVPLDVKL